VGALLDTISAFTVTAVRPAHSPCSGGYHEIEEGERARFDGAGSGCAEEYEPCRRLQWPEMTNCITFPMAGLRARQTARVRTTILPDAGGMGGRNPTPCRRRRCLRGRRRQECAAAGWRRLMRSAPIPNLRNDGCAPPALSQLPGIRAGSSQFHRDPCAHLFERGERRGFRTVCTRHSVVVARVWNHRGAEHLGRADRYAQI